jgi:PAS domain-containing protein
MKRVCAWCNEPLDDSEVEVAEGVDLITHGVCEKCEAFVTSNQPRSLRQFVNLFSEPVVCVDAGARMLTANDAACAVLGLDQSGVGDLLCGQVVQCRWACSPDGCGSTEHCLACSIREVIRSAFESDEMFARRPAYVDREGADGAGHRVTLYVTSERRGDVVLLRIDGVDESAGAPHS